MLSRINTQSTLNQIYDGRELLLSLNMAAPQEHHLFHSSIADHSFSADKQTLAVARENNVDLYRMSGNKFSLSDELKGHEKTVTGVDIAPDTGRIVTCSQGELDLTISITFLLTL